jgi:hypothetical protein
MNAKRLLPLFFCAAAGCCRPNEMTPVVVGSPTEAMLIVKSPHFDKKTREVRLSFNLVKPGTRGLLLFRDAAPGLDAVAAPSMFHDGVDVLFVEKQYIHVITESQYK